MSTLLLINGPNLSELGHRKTEIYGNETLQDIENLIKVEIQPFKLSLKSIQSDGEKELIEALRTYHNSIGAIINPGALMMAGWSFRDAVEMYPNPWIEVHLSNIWARESFRHHSILSPIASGIICGLGAMGYVLAARAILAHHDNISLQNQTSDKTIEPKSDSE